MLNNQLNDESNYQSYALPLIATALLILLGNTLLYYYYYPDVFWPRTLPYFEDFATDELIEYRQIGGTWELENEQLVQRDPALVDILAVIPALTLEAEQPYEFSSSISVIEGPKGGGIVFNMQNRSTIANSHLIRLGSNDGADYMIYGYLDGSREFTVQGSTNLENLSSEFELGVNVAGNTYTILLNDVPVAEGVELFHKGGNLALTTWNSKVAFDNVSVLGPDQSLAVAEVPDETVVVAEAPEVEASTVVVEQAPAQQEAVIIVEQVPDQQSEPVVVEQAPSQTVQVEVVTQPQSEPETIIQQEAVGDVSFPASGSLPYFENFADDVALDYLPLSGDWALQDESALQGNAQLVDAVATVPELVMLENESYDYSADLNMISGAKGGGLSFNLQLADTIRGSHMVRFGEREDGSEYVIYGYFDENRFFNVQGLTPPQDYDSETQLKIEVRDNVYNILQNDRTIVSDVPLVYQGGRLGLTTWNSAVQFDNVAVSSLNGPRVAVVTEEVEPIVLLEGVGELPLFEDFTDQTEHQFIEVGGNWQIQEETMLQLNPQVFDVMALIPNFVLSNDEPYDFSSNLLILEGPKGGGLVFNSQNSDSLRESHMVRFGSNDGNDYMIYGFFDENRSFNVQGSSQPPEFTDSANLGVSISGSTYNILVNEEIVVRDVPLVYLGGRMGLTTWNSSVGFDDIAIVSPFADQAVDESDLFTNPRPLNTYFSADLDQDTDPINWRAVSGTWEFAEEGLTHPDAEGFDNLIMHANPYDRYSFTTNLRMGTGEGGAGIIFNAPSSDTIAGAHVARYAVDNQISWGYFDNDGVFVEQGVADVAPARDELHKFEIRVDGANYSVRLDDELLGEAIPLVSDQGRVGFTSTLREATFENIALTGLAQ